MIFYIPPHTGLWGIQKIVRHHKMEPFPYAFLLYVLLTGKRKKLQAGEYVYQRSFFDMVDAMVTGRRFLRKFTVPEGWTVEEVIKKLKSESLLSGDIKVVPREGMIFPSTYYFIRYDDRQQLLDRMQKEMYSRLERLWLMRPKDFALESKEHLLNLASIVEKETPMDTEKGKIAAVFINRLKQCRALQADPTIAYHTKTHPIKASDLKIKTPYNTYMNKGLPPTPICCPGAASLKAVIDNIKDDSLFFVVTGTGGHAFSKTFQEHKENIKKWKATRK